jgi:hypothetical protein
VGVRYTHPMFHRHNRSAPRAALAIGVALAAMLALAPGKARGDIGLGLVVGEPTGLSAELGLGGRSSLALAVGLDAFEGSGFYVHLDYLMRLGYLARWSSSSLVPYVGLGGVVKGGDAHVGARVPFGLSLEFRTAPVQIFGELALRVMVVPDLDVGVGGAIGFRYFF